MQLYEHMFVFVKAPDLELRAAIDAIGVSGASKRAVALDHEDLHRGSRHRPVVQVNGEGLLRGVRPGMTVALALDICPDLILLRPDPVGAAQMWERDLRRIEGIGARVESTAVGSACFDPSGLLPLYGGIRGVLGELFEALEGRCLAGVGPTRLAASVEMASSTGEVRVIRSEELLEVIDPLPLESLRGRLEGGPEIEEGLISALRWLGIGRLGEFRRLGEGPVTNRFGMAGAEAWRIASGKEEPIRPRRPEEEVRVTVEMPDDGFSIGLSPALGLISSKMAARLGGLGRTARSLRLEAGLEGGGSWRSERSPKLPTASPDLIRLLFEPSLELITGMPTELSMVATSLADYEPAQSALFETFRESRRRKLDEATRQVRAAVGDHGLLKVVEANPRSRLPERRVILAPLDPVE